jgi:hypothetical protein
MVRPFSTPPHAGNLQDPKALTVPYPMIPCLERSCSQGESGYNLSVMRSGLESVPSPSGVSFSVVLLVILESKNSEQQVRSYPNVCFLTCSFVLSI